VIARGNQKQDIFIRAADFKTYLAYLSEYKERYHFHLYAYALMKNHLHLLLEVEQIPLFRIMHVLQFRYARYFNTRYGKVGHLFQGRYKAILCDKDDYLLALVRYIHINPIRAKLVDDPERYPWTSHVIYLGKEKHDLIDQDLVLAQLSKNRSAARRAYLRFVLQGLEAGHQEQYYKVKDQRYLGEEEFIEEVEGKRENLEPSVYDIPLKEIALEVSKAAEIPQESLYSLTRARRGALGRSMVAYLARKVSGYLVRDIAEHFRREPMTISQAIIKLEDLIQRDKDLKETVDSLESVLKKKGRKKYLITIA